MEAAEFEKTFEGLMEEARVLQERRVTLETDLADLRQKIANLDLVLENLAPLAGIDWFRSDPENLSGLGLTDAIRAALQLEKKRFSAAELRDFLTEKKYDFSGLSSPMASVYKILSRLEQAEEIEREKEGSRVYFRWKETPITDKGITF